MTGPFYFPSPLPPLPDHIAKRDQFITEDQP